jgi:hypothetical protein
MVFLLPFLTIWNLPTQPFYRPYFMRGCNRRTISSHPIAMKKPDQGEWLGMGNPQASGNMFADILIVLGCFWNNIIQKKS